MKSKEKKASTKIKPNISNVETKELNCPLTPILNENRDNTQTSLDNQLKDCNNFSSKDKNIINNIQENFSANQNFDLSTIQSNENLIAIDTSTTSTQEIDKNKTQPHKKSLFSVHDLAYSAVFVVLIILGAFIKIPIPLVPITLQITITTLAGIILGAKLGSLTVAVYLIMGLCGVPIFSSGGGIGYVMQPSFGYLIGFFFGTLLTGWLAHLPSPKNIYLRHFLAGIAGLFLIYIIGCSYIYFLCNYALKIPMSASKVIVTYFLILFPKDVALVALACLASIRLTPYLAKQGFNPHHKIKKLNN